MDIVAEIERAAQQVYPIVRETPLDFSPHFSKRTAASVLMKLENLQHTGSFKLRGAVNKLQSLTAAERQAGCVAASSGNHGAAMAYALSHLGIKGVIFVPQGTSPTKVAAIRRLHDDLRVHEGDPLATELHARAHAEQHGMIYVSPYNDARIIAGQGTIGVELLRQQDEIDAVFVSVGGGGLISGIAGYLKPKLPAVRIIGCLPENSPVMMKSIEAGHIVEWDCSPTLSDGTAGGIEPGAITFDLCQRLVDDYVLVSEDDIRAAMLEFMDSHHLLLEGAAGVALAGLLKKRGEYKDKKVAVVICGGNISLDTLRAVL